MYFPTHMCVYVNMCIFIYMSVCVCVCSVCAHQPSWPGPYLLVQLHSYFSPHCFQFCPNNIRWFTVPQTMLIHWNANMLGCIYREVCLYLHSSVPTSRFSKVFPDSSFSLVNCCLLHAVPLLSIYFFCCLYDCGLYWVFEHQSQPLDS